MPCALDVLIAVDCIFGGLLPSRSAFCAAALGKRYSQLSERQSERGLHPTFHTVVSFIFPCSILCMRALRAQRTSFVAVFSSMHGGSTCSGVSLFRLPVRTLSALALKLHGASRSYCVLGKPVGCTALPRTCLCLSARTGFVCRCLHGLVTPLSHVQQGPCRDYNSWVHAILCAFHFLSGVNQGVSD